MKKDLTKLAMLGLLAAFCISANESGREIAMSKCSKDTTAKSSTDSDSMCPDKSDDTSDDDSGSNMNNKKSMPKKSGCGGNDTSYSDEEGDTSEEVDASLLMKTKRNVEKKL